MSPYFAAKHMASPPAAVNATLARNAPRRCYSDRMRLLRLSVGLTLLTLLPFALPAQVATGKPGLLAVDAIMQGLLTKYSVPGAALAVTLQGRLAYARGYGYQNTTSNTQVQPDTPFRQASISKTFTAIAILELVDHGKIKLDDPAFGYLAALEPPANEIGDTRIASITIRECLNHTGGWDRGIVGDPVSQSIEIARNQGAALPGSANWFIQYMWTRPLQHSPGTVYAYSNVGYVVLGAIIEHVSGMRYEDFVRKNVLQPLGIVRAYLGSSIASDPANSESTYYPYPGQSCLASLFPYVNACVPAPYAEHNFEVAAAAGGWVVDEIDLCRFLNGIPKLISASMLQQMQTETAAFNGSPSFFGLGFAMQPNGANLDWSKDGSLSGTSSYLYRRYNGFAWAVVFNSRPNQTGTTTSGQEGGSFEADFVNQISSVLDQSLYSLVDQFPDYAATLVTPELNSVVQSAGGRNSIVSGSWVTIYGQNLSVDSRLWYPSEFVGASLPQYVDNTTVTINGAPCAVYYVSPGQLNVQAPSGLPAGSVQVVVTHNGQPSAAFSAQASASAPGLFTYSAAGLTLAAAQHTSDYSTVGITGDSPGTRPATAGEVLAFYGGGFAPAAAGQIVNGNSTLPGAPTATVGGKQAQATSVYLIGAGLFQINITVPQVPTGNQPVVITYNGQSTQSGVVIPVAAP